MNRKFILGSLLVLAILITGLIGVRASSAAPTGGYAPPGGGGIEGPPDGYCNLCVVDLCWVTDNSAAVECLFEQSSGKPPKGCINWGICF